MKYPNARLVLFARTPIEGRVKTRLAETLGAAAACHLYCNMIEHMVRMTTAAGLAELVVYVHPETRTPFLDRLADRYAIEIKPQQGADLGERMFNAMAAELRAADYVVLFGADCVAIEPAYLEQALALLATDTQRLFGPAEDGGYVLIGLSRPERAVFEQIDWGTSRVMQQSRERCLRHGLAWKELPARYDIDTGADWQRLRDEQPAVYNQLNPTDVIGVTSHER